MILPYLILYILFALILTSIILVWHTLLNKKHYDKYIFRLNPLEPVNKDNFFHMGFSIKTLNDHLIAGIRQGPAIFRLIVCFIFPFYFIYKWWTYRNINTYLYILMCCGSKNYYGGLKKTR